MKPRIALPLSRVTDYGLRSPRREAPRRPTHQSGTAVIVVLVIIAILMIYVAANIRTLNNVGRELKLIEQKQVRRLQGPPRNLEAPASDPAKQHRDPGGT
jgi:hypothetical protein